MFAKLKKFLAIEDINKRREIKNLQREKTKIEEYKYLY